MRCEDVKRVLQDYLDGLLSGEEKGTVESHLKECASCADEYDTLKRVVDSVRSLPKHKAPEILKLRIKDAIRGEKLSLWRTLSTISTAAAALLLVVLLLSLQWQPVKVEGQRPDEVQPPSHREAPSDSEKAPRKKDEDETIREASKKPLEPAADTGAAQTVAEERKADGKLRQEKVEMPREGEGFKAPSIRQGAKELEKEERLGKTAQEPLDVPVPSPGAPQRALTPPGVAKRPEEKDFEKKEREDYPQEVAKKQEDDRTLGTEQRKEELQKQKKKEADKYVKEIENALQALSVERKEVRLILGEEAAQKLLKQLSSIAEEDEKIAKRSEVHRNSSVEVRFDTNEQGWRVLLSVLKPEQNLSDEESGEKDDAPGKAAEPQVLQRDKREKGEKEVEIVVIVEVRKASGQGR
ncbi:MAG: zf-HC2 domain-containing protein [Planctomycetota bacterium]|nr:zf-HC2 domain-containing protein [Planctomycetota bacterium]